MVWEIVSIIVRIIGYSLFLYGVWRLVGENFIKVVIQGELKSWMRRRRLKRYRMKEEKEQEKEQSQSRLIRHLQMVLESTSSKESHPGLFIMWSLILGVVSITLLTIGLHDGFYGTLLGFAIGLTPYGFKRFKLANRRLNASYGFMMNFHLILQAYQSNRGELYFVIYQVTREIEHKELKRSFLYLLNALQKERSDTSFREATEVFVYSINSSFAKRFGKLLLKSHIDQANIQEALTQMNGGINKRKRDLKQEKTQNLETIILGFLPITILPILFYFSYEIASYMDFWTIFMLDVPLLMFTISLIMALLSAVLSFLLTKPRSDV